MKTTQWIAPIIAALAAAVLLSCTQSPLSDDHITVDGSTITGSVNLLGSHNEGVYVWLQGLNLSTRTDRNGHFTLEMPKGPSTTNADGFAGVYKLYFYVSNYSLATADVVVRNGEFVNGEGDIGPNGELLTRIEMGRILEVFTIVQPPSVFAGYRDKIDVQVTLRAGLRPVQVVFPKSVGGLLGGILLRNLDTDSIHVDIPDVGAQIQDFDTITITPKSRRMVFHLNGINYRELFLPIGEYEIIPYFLILHDDMPAGLLKSIGDNVTQITQNFLRIPTRRTGGLFALKPVSE